MSLLQTNGWTFYLSLLQAINKLHLYIVLIPFFYSSCYDNLHIKNSQYEIIAENDDEANDSSTSNIIINGVRPGEENTYVKDLERSSPKLYAILNAFNTVLKESEAEDEVLKAAYLEVRNVAMQRRSLQFGWFNYNQEMQNGFKTAEQLGVITSSERFLEKHNNMTSVVDRIFRFESDFKYKYRNFLTGSVSKEELKRGLHDFGIYLESVLMLDTMLKTKRPEGMLRYVSDLRLDKSNKICISQKTADLLSSRVVKLVNSLDKFSNSYSTFLSKFATIENILDRKFELDILSRIMGVTIDPKRDNLDYASLLYGGKIIPGSILATWMNSRSLLDGSWNSIIMRSNSADSVVSILYDINEMRKSYSNVISKIEEKLMDPSCDKQIGTGVKELLGSMKKDESFVKVHERGKEAIVLARKILLIKKEYDIGRSHPTVGLKYVGKWRIDDSSKQIFESDAIKLLDGIDFLSAMAVFIDSNETLRVPLYPSRVARYLQNSYKAKFSVDCNNPIHDKLWICETIEEQSIRENNKRSRYNLLAAQLIVLLCITSVFPILFPLTMTLFAIECAISFGIQSEFI